MKRLLLHIKYYLATKLVFKQMYITNLNLDTEEDILITAVKLSTKT